jgi:hypothetical protein
MHTVVLVRFSEEKCPLWGRRLFRDPRPAAWSVRCEEQGVYLPPLPEVELLESLGYQLRVGVLSRRSRLLSNFSTLLIRPRRVCISASTAVRVSSRPASSARSSSRVTSPSAPPCPGIPSVYGPLRRPSRATLRSLFPDRLGSQPSPALSSFPGQSGDSELRTPRNVRATHLLTPSSANSDVAGPPKAEVGRIPLLETVWKIVGRGQIKAPLAAKTPILGESFHGVLPRVYRVPEPQGRAHSGSPNSFSRQLGE